MPPCFGADEHAADVRGEHVLDAVMLTLVEFIGSEFNRAAIAAHADAEGDDLTVVVHAHELRSGDERRRRALQSTRELCQRVGSRRGVLR